MPEKENGTIEERVLDVLKDEGGMENVTLETDLLKENLDSLDRIEMVMELGEEFDIEIPDEDIDRLYGQNTLTPSDIAKYVGVKLARKKGYSK